MSSKSRTMGMPPTKKAKTELSKPQQILAFLDSKDSGSKFTPQKNIALPVKTTKLADQKSKVNSDDKRGSMDKFVKRSSRVPSTSKNIDPSQSHKDTEPQIVSGISPTRKSARRSTLESSTDRSLAELERSIQREKKKSRKIQPSKLFDEGDEQKMAMELERLANENLGDLCKFPSDDEGSDSSPSLNSSQKIGVLDKNMNASFIGRARELIQSKELTEIAERDILNIHIDFVGLHNLCRAKNFYVLTRQSRSAEILAKFPVTNFELIFLMSPTHSCRLALLQDFYRQFGQSSSQDQLTSGENIGARRFPVTPHQIASILQFIGQLGEEGVESSQSNSSSQDSSSFLASLFEHSMAENQLFKITEAAFWQAFEELQSSQGSKPKKMRTIDWRDHRHEVCLENICLFCSILPLLDLVEWRTRDICTFLLQICGVYMDEIVVEIRPKLSSAIEMLIDSLPAEKAEKVVSKFLKHLAALSIDFRALFLVVSSFVRLRFFSAPTLRFQFLNAVFAKVLAEKTTASNSATNTNDARSNGTASASLSLSDLRPSREATSGIIELFAVFPDIAQALIERPTDFYISMQMLDLCVTDSVISKEYPETLNFLSESLKSAKDHTKHGSRMDEIILRSMSDVAHRIGLVIHRRRATAYENCDTARYSMFSSSSEDEEDLQDENVRLNGGGKASEDDFL